MRLYRSIATLAVLQVLCFLFLSQLEPDFFLLHFYQTIVYLALLLLFYMEDRWAYRYFGACRLARARLCHGITGCRRSAVAEAGTWPRAYEYSELPGRRDVSAERFDDCGVRPTLAQGVWGLWQVIDNIRS